jgi:hypothetical protein
LKILISPIGEFKIPLAMINILLLLFLCIITQNKLNESKINIRDAESAVI